MLIADACERYLRMRGVVVWRSDGSIEDACLENDSDYLGDLFSTFRGMVMFPGGGNIGIYPDNGQIRGAVISHLRQHHRCLVFSQSALQPEPALIDSRVTVWCRDSTSQAILRTAGIQTDLVPDMALFMDDTIPNYPDGRAVFYIRRQPGIDAETIDNNVQLDCRFADLTFSRPLDEIIAELKSYEVIISDRLHGALIALMMRKKVIMLPVAYHKSRAFYDTWLAEKPGVRFAEDGRSLPREILQLESFTTDLRQILCERANPAFDRFLLHA
jgi:exopolysaccharide biosynthesis predicted pyruvyltransferase EpsI